MKFYHASPENFSRFTPKYNKTFKCKGVFVSPTFKSVIKDWAFWVLNKKNIKANYASYNKENYYSYIWIYTIELPKNIIQDCKEFYDEVFHSEDWSEGKLYSFWYWGEQLFIPDYLVDEIKIIKKRRYNLTEIYNLYNRLSWKNWEYNTMTSVNRNKDEGENHG